jgi:hypothetical protein
MTASMISPECLSDTIKPRLAILFFTRHLKALDFSLFGISLPLIAPAPTTNVNKY